MVYIVLDTNIWIYIAEGEHPDITTFILDKVKNSEIIILSNEVILSEWNRHREKALEKGKTKVNNSFNGTVGSFKSLKSKLDQKEKEQVDILSEKYRSFLATDLKEVEERVSRIDQILNGFCINTDVTPDMKIFASERAIEKKAPFHNSKNNMADCLILLSTLKYIQEDEFGKHIKNAIFVSNNIADFSEDGKPDELHPDIKLLVDPYLLKFTRNSGEVLKLTEEYVQGINDFLQFIDDKIIEQLEYEAEIMRGK